MDRPLRREELMSVASCAPPSTQLPLLQREPDVQEMEEEIFFLTAVELAIQVHSVLVQSNGHHTTQASPAEWVHRGVLEQGGRLVCVHLYGCVCAHTRATRHVCMF